MTYIKPAIVDSMNSIKAIQGHLKLFLWKMDGSLVDHRWVTIAAYKADE